MTKIMRKENEKKYKFKQILQQVVVRNILCTEKHCIIINVYNL